MTMADKKEHDTTSSKEGEAWGTLEELLLACAISRHGTNSWDFIAVEVQKRATSRNPTNKKSSNNFLKAFTPHNCEQRYHALKSRFDVTGGGDRDDNDGENDVAGERDLREKLPFMIDELRKLRVEELRREVERHDVSIVSLKLKVRRLEEERGRNSLKAEDEADLRTGADRRGRGPDGSSVEVAGKSVSRELSDEPEDRSLNESKTTSHKAVQVKESNRLGKPDPVRSALEFEPDKEFSAEKGAGRTSQPVRLGNPGELIASASESKRGVKESEAAGDVQSLASLPKRKRRGWRRRNGVGSSTINEGEVKEFSPANERMNEKSQSLIMFLEILRSHKHGLVFHRRLPSQETQKYRKLIRQHMDVETVKSKLERGIYSDCHPMFYRDLLLIFSNALLFFRKGSTQHLAARDLRRLLANEIAARKPNPLRVPDPDPDAKNEKPPSSANIVVCRRRRNLSSIITPPSSINEEELEAVENDVDHRKKASGGRERLNLSKSSVDDDGSNVKKKRDEWWEEEDEQEQAANNNKRMKQNPSSKEGERVNNNNKKKVVVGKKMDEAPRTRVSGRRSISTSAKKKPR